MDNTSPCQSCSGNIVKQYFELYLYIFFAFNISSSVYNLSISSCKIVYHDFLIDDTPSENASFGRHNTSSGIYPVLSNAFLNKYFSTPFL